MLKYFFIFCAFLPVLMSSMCKKDYYTGTENVRLNASINSPNETIHLGDTLKIDLSIPSSITSESGQINNVSSVQEALYTFTFYQVDTVTNLDTRIRNSTSIFVSKGSINSYLAAVSTSTGSLPFESILNLVPPSKGLYYVEITGSGSIKVNNSYQAFLKINFSVTSKHWNLLEPFTPGISASLAANQDAQGYGFYCFRVN